MALFSHGNLANFWLGASDLSDWVTSASIDGSREIRDVRPIGANPVSRVVGPYMATINLEGAYDPACDAILSPLFLAGTPATSTFDFEPSGTGGSNRSFTGSAYVATYRVDSSGSDVATWRATLAVVGTITNAV
jgi:hypothetical protein